MKRAAILILLALCAAPCALQAQALGRLFYSEDERARLEQQRGQTALPAGAPRTVEAVRLDGVVLRSGGPATWFVNGAAVDARTLPSMSARPSGGALQLPGGEGRAVTLRPGERTAIDDTGQAAPPDGVIDIRPGRRP